MQLGLKMDDPAYGVRVTLRELVGRVYYAPRISRARLSDLRMNPDMPRSHLSELRDRRLAYYRTVGSNQMPGSFGISFA